MVFLAFSVSVGYPPGCQEEDNLQFIAHSSKRQYRKRILRQLYVPVSVELLDVNPSLFCATDDAFRSLDLPVVFWSVVWFVFSCGEIEFTPIMPKEAPLSTTYILSFDLIGLDSDVFVSSMESRHVCTVSCLIFLILRPNLSFNSGELGISYTCFCMTV